MMIENWYKNISGDLNFLFYIMTDVFDTGCMVGYLKTLNQQVWGKKAIMAHFGNIILG